MSYRSAAGIFRVNLQTEDDTPQCCAKFVFSPSFSTDLVAFELLLTKFTQPSCTTDTSSGVRHVTEEENEAPMRVFRMVCANRSKLPMSPGLSPSASLFFKPSFPGLLTCLAPHTFERYLDDSGAPRCDEIPEKEATLNKLAKLLVGRRSAVHGACKGPVSGGIYRCGCSCARER